MYNFFRSIPRSVTVANCENGGGETMMPTPPTSEYQAWAKNGALGGAVGYVVGCMVACPENLKVAMEYDDKKRFTVKESFKVMRQTGLRNINGFGWAFAGACAIELSIIEGTKKKLTDQGYSLNFVNIFGASIAALSAAAWLTPADHTLVRAKEFKETPLQALQNLSKMGVKGLFAGYSPMVIREFVFSLAHFCVAERIGRFYYNEIMHPESPLSDEASLPNGDNEYYQVAGNISAGVPGAIITQPVDVCKGELQRQVAEGRELSLSKAVEAIKQRGFINGAMRGLAPRMVLATAGGTMVATGYKALKKYTEEVSPPQSSYGMGR